MNLVVVLLRFEILRLRNWFRTFLGAKIAVLLGFAGVLAVVIAVEYLMATTFFRFLATNAQFGQAVAQYSLNAALLVLFILALVSSLAASTDALYQSPLLRFLMSLPLSPSKIFISRLAIATFSSTFFVVILLTPIIIAFDRHFPTGPDMLLRALVVLAALTLTSQFLGATASLLLVVAFGRVSRRSLALVFGIAVGCALLLMRFLFPPSFFRLYAAEDWPSFQRQLGQLPLLATNLPTNWLATTLTHGWRMETAAALVGTLSIIILSLWLGEKHYLASWRKAQEGGLIAGKASQQVAKERHFPRPLASPTASLLTNEILAVTRSPREVTYTAFLTGLMVVLLFLMRNIPSLEQAASQFLPAVYALSLVGLSYLFMTLAARLVYPLLAKEKRVSWLLFSIPVGREQILSAKILFALFLGTLALPFAVVAAKLMEISGTMLVFYTLLTWITTTTVSLLQLFLGAISPNFSQADNLEATSTSGSGLAAITLSLLAIAISGFMAFAVSANAIDGKTALGTVVVLSGILLFPLFIASRREVETCEF